MFERDHTDGGEEKLKRITVAMTVAGVLLTLFLIIVLVVSFVQMGVKNSELNRWEKEFKYYEQLQEEAGDKIKFYQTEQGLRYLALQQGWSNPR
ncbi:MAG: hypothetical protein K2H43_06210 [Clostridia bacterium]|nr:hypothetical protein [Clostridia bacterium]